MIIFSDIHLHHYKIENKIEKKRIESTIEAIKELCFYGEKFNQKNFIFLGDWFHKKDGVRMDLIKSSIDILTKLSNKFNIYMLPGNHDYSNINNLKIFSNIPNVYIIDKIEVINIEDEDIVFVPFLFNDIFKNNISKYAMYKYVMGHFNIKPITKNGINIEELSLFDFVISGHHHDYVQKNNLYYVGSLIPIYPTEQQNKFALLFDPTYHIPIRRIAITTRYILNPIPEIKTKKEIEKIIKEETEERKKIELENILYDYAEDKKIQYKIIEDIIKEAKE